MPPAQDLAAVFAALEPYAGLHSQLVDCQIALWLQQLSISELQQLRTAIPSPRTGHPYTAEAMTVELARRITDAIASHPTLQPSPQDPLFAIEAGRLQGARVWKSAVTTAKALPEGEARLQFILGIRQSAGGAFSFTEGAMIREVTQALLPASYQINSSEEEDWMFLWPANSIVQFALTKSEQSRFSIVRHLVENAHRVCSKLEEAQALLPAFGSSAQGQSPLVPEAMGWVLAGRDAASFMKWWEKLPQNHREYAITRAIAPLLRQDPTLIQPVLAQLTPEYVLRHDDITAAWYPHDPAAALAYYSRKSGFPEDFRSWTHSASMAPRMKSIPSALAVELLNRYPGLEACLNLVDSFDPLKQTPAEFANDILRLKEPKPRNFQLFQFAQKWGYHDGASANAWASHITLKEDRETWIRSLFGKWFKRDPEAAAAAAGSAPELDADQRKKPLPVTRTIKPARYVKHDETRPSAIPPVNPKPVPPITRQSLAERARPGQSPAHLASLCQTVLTLGLPEIHALLDHFITLPPVDARENQVRQLLLERWAMLEPEPATRWIIVEGNGMHREVMTLALANLVLVNPPLTIELMRQLPWENWQARSMILKSLALRSHQESCEFGLSQHWDIRLIGQDWLRLDRAAALAWMHPRWLDDSIVDD